MQYKHRKTNGQYRSKKSSDRIFYFHSFIVLLMACLPISAFMSIPESVTVYNAPHVEWKTIEAHEPSKVEKALREIPHTSSTTDDVIRYLYTHADDRGIDGDQVAHTIYCESMFYNIQSGVVRNGVREPSYGLAQIHIPSHRHITKDKALNPYFAIDFMLDNWNTSKWYGYDRNTDTCTNDITEYWAVDN